jgi:hypothetical protein
MPLRLRQGHFHFIDKAPTPILSGFKRRNNRVSGAHEVLARVAIFRIIATPHMAAAAA